MLININFLLNPIAKIAQPCLWMNALSSFLFWIWNSSPGYVIPTYRLCQKSVFSSFRPEPLGEAEKSLIKDPSTTLGMTIF